MKPKMSVAMLRAINKLQNISRPTELEGRIEFVFSALDLSLDGCDFQYLLDNDVAVLTIEGDREDEWSAIHGAKHAECIVTLDKTVFIDFFLSKIDGASNLLFFSIDAFQTWFSSLPSPFDASHPFNRSGKTVIWLNGLDDTYSGTCLSILPLEAPPESVFERDEIDLPGDESIRSQVHVLSDFTVKIEPVRFRLPDIAADEECLKPIFDCYQELLVSCLVKEFYTREKVVVSGIKRITTALSNDEFEINLKQLLVLEECVRWVYAERTETRLLLLMDRLSLDLPEGSSLLPSLYSHLLQALEQAQWRYEFVIKDRKEAHAKELAGLQKDVKAASDGYSGAAHELVVGLLKDALSSIFLLSIGLLSRLAGREGFLESQLFAVLSKGLACYLLIGVIVRVAIGYQGLSLSFNDLMYWKDVTRNHMSKNEFQEHVTVRTRPYKLLYHQSAIGVFIVHLLLALFVWNLPDLFTNSSGSENSVLMEAQGKKVDQVALKMMDQVPSVVTQITATQDSEKIINANEISPNRQSSSEVLEKNADKNKP